MTHDEMIAVIQAHKAGKKIEVRCKADVGNHGMWDHANPDWNFDACEYRVAPEPKYRPWQAVDEVPVGKVVRKLDSSRTLVTGCGIRVDGVCVMIGSDSWLYAAEVLDTYTMDDGSPCGVKE